MGISGEGNRNSGTQSEHFQINYFLRHLDQIIIALEWEETGAYHTAAMSKVRGSSIPLPFCSFYKKLEPNDSSFGGTEGMESCESIQT